MLMCFQMLPSADFIVPVEIETQTHNVYVIKRPGVDHFLKEMGKIYEIVVFTASLSKVGVILTDRGALWLTPKVRRPGPRHT